MKYIFIFLFFFAASQCKGQKYILLDESLSHPAIYTNHLTEMEKYKKFYPVEVKNIPQFLSVLEKIEQRLSETKIKSKLNNYKVGCSEFTGTLFMLSNGERIDYTIISTCEGFKIKMHLCDAKITNANNEYFIKAWINYIKSNLKPNKKNTHH